MAILRDPDSRESKERVKWEAQHTAFGPGQRPYVKHDYPMMLHKAGRPSGGMGGPVIIEHQEVGSERERDSYHSQGFRATPLEALAVWDAQDKEFAGLAAELNYDAKNKHGELARAEIAAAQAAAPDHLPSMPVTPIKPRAQAAVAAGK
jgi:hypothetical protein